MVKMEIPMTNSRNKFFDVVLTCSNITIRKWTLNKCIELESESGRFLLNMQTSNFHLPIALHWMFPIVQWGGVERMLATFSTVGIKSSTERKSTRTKSCQDLGLQELEKDLQSYKILANQQWAWTYKGEFGSLVVVLWLIIVANSAKQTCKDIYQLVTLENTSH